MTNEVTSELLDMLERLSERGSPPPWKASVEGRDHSSEDSFVQTGADDDRAEDIYVSRDSGPADASDLDLIAAARTRRLSRSS